MMNRERIAELRAEDEAERLSMGELLEIQSACDAAGISITEDNDPLTAGDQLDELEARLPKVYTYTVTLMAESQQAADQIMAARTGYDEDLSEDGIGDYRFLDVIANQADDCPPQGIERPEVCAECREPFTDHDHDESLCTNDGARFHAHCWDSK